MTSKYYVSTINSDDVHNRFIDVKVLNSIKTDI